MGSDADAVDDDSLRTKKTVITSMSRLRRMARLTELGDNAAPLDDE